MQSSHSPDRLVVAVDDDHAVANAGLLLPATLAERPGIQAVVDQLVDLGGWPGHHQPGRKVLTVNQRSPHPNATPSQPSNHRQPRARG